MIGYEANEACTKYSLFYLIVGYVSTNILKLNSFSLCISNGAHYISYIPSSRIYELGNWS